MKDPDRTKSKTDFIFFARQATTQEQVRVLVQLSIAECQKNKVLDSFQGMINLVPFKLENKELNDYRLFIGPKCSVTFGSNIGERNLLGNRCFLFSKDSGISDAFQLPWKYICNPRSAKDAIMQLLCKAEEERALEVTRRLGYDFNTSQPLQPRKRHAPSDLSPRRKFETLDEFYAALESEECLSEKAIKHIKSRLEKQEIQCRMLPRLTDEKLEKYGIVAGGHREAILALLGK